jgi:predicted dehydrogenase
MNKDELRIGFLGFGSRGVSFIAPVLDNHIHNRVTTVIDPDVSKAKFFLDKAAEKGEIPHDEAADVRIIRDLSELHQGEVDVLFLTAPERVITVFGEEGSLEFSERDRSVILTNRWGTQSETIVSSPGDDGHGGADTGVIDAFFRCIRQNVDPVSTIADCAWALATALAAYESRDTERWVEIRPIVDSIACGLD